MNLSVFGAGSIGSLFAGRIAYSGFDVGVVGRNPHITKIREKGLTVIEEEDKLVSFLPAETKFDPISDAILVTTKAYDNTVVANILANNISKNKPVFLVQNGMGNEQVFKEKLPDNPIYRAITTEAAELIHPGIVKHVAFGKTTFGLVSGEGNGFSNQVKNILSKSGFFVKTTQNIQLKMWHKLLANATICPLGTILHSRNGNILDRPSTERIFYAILEEGIALAEHLLPQEDFSESLDFILKIIEKTRNNKCSMLQDIERGRRTEIDFMNGFIAQESRRYGLKAPVNTAITELIRYLESHP
ncbi:MAG: 2-dehydropantoate 2-reductase [Candidatus Heimdallarchaeota archaeon]|nr:2-dehydropantoate 2-reductase [Candidatus Heimdallarchaeota archaeon]